MRKALIRIWDETSPIGQKFYVMGSAILSLGAAGLNVYSVFPLKHIFESLAAPNVGNNHKIGHILEYILLMESAKICKTFADLLLSYSGNKVSVRMFNSCLDKVNRLKKSERNKIDIDRNITNDLLKIKNIPSDIYSDIIDFISCFIQVFSIAVVSTLEFETIVFVTFWCLLVIKVPFSYFISKSITDKYEKLVPLISNGYGRLFETIREWDAIKIFGKEDFEIEKSKSIQSLITEHEYYKKIYEEICSVADSILGYTAFVIIFLCYLDIIAIKDEEIASSGEVVEAITFYHLFLNPLNKITNILPILSQKIYDLEDILGYLEKHEKEDIDKGKDIPINELFKIKFKNVSFWYDEMNECDLAFISSDPTESTLDDLQIKSNAAYVRSGAKLFYVNKANKECTEIKLNTFQLQEFDQKLIPSQPRKLEKSDLKKVTLITGHTKILKTIADLSFSAKSGDVIGVVGKTGVGKSTFINIMLGNYDNYDGNIFINGAELKELKKNKYRDCLFTVSQNSAIFSGESLGYNIKYGFRNIKYEEIEYQGHSESSETKNFTVKKNASAVSRFFGKPKNGYNAIQDASISSLLCKQNTTLDDKKVEEAMIKSKIDHLPKLLKDGYKSTLPSTLSGGERQRVSICRVFLQRPANSSSAPKIYLYDEPTSALDAETEYDILKELNSLRSESPGVTFLVTHKLAILSGANKILFFEGNGVVVSGTHQKLMENKSYKRTWDLQSGSTYSNFWAKPASPVQNDGGSTIVIPHEF